MISYPSSQHPDRYLNVITDDLELSLREFRDQRHACEFEVQEVKDATGMDFKFEIIRYKYDDGPPLDFTPQVNGGTDNGGE